ncbi:GspH/FimT family pseudopilin [Desulfobacula sp.]|uniref:GspH/FimT family pseudopilin n=1 Tax=Desulfobacula sp. TaxID=2593537 RepID=UPI00262E0AEB|nr:GspH/FimT family pseudopilin [Desulfobacula sp.]
MRKKVCRNSGFTLIEVMIVIGMIGILSAISIPSAMKWLPNYRLKAAARDLYSNMQKAKVEAVKRNTDVLIKFTSEAYAPAGGKGSYQVFVDDGGTDINPGIADNQIRDGDEQVLAQVNMPKNVSLYDIIGLTGNTTAGYNSRGLPCTALGSVYFQNNHSRYYRVALSTAGNVKITTNNDGGTTWN